MKSEEIGYASIKGMLHENANIPNQDAYSVKRYKFGTILVVSDGLGSKKYSDIGSKAVGKAINRAVQIWNEYPERDIVPAPPDSSISRISLLLHSPASPSIPPTGEKCRHFDL